MNFTNPLLETWEHWFDLDVKPTTEQVNQAVLDFTALVETKLVDFEAWYEYYENRWQLVANLTNPQSQWDELVQLATDVSEHLWD